MANANFTRLFCKSLLTVLLFVLVGCGGSANNQQAQNITPPVTGDPRPNPTPAPAQITLTASQVFTAHVGDVWTFKNGYGDITTITIESPSAGNYLPAGSVVFHYRKNNCRAYPAVGICGAEYLFALTPEQDGSWRSLLTAFIFPNAPPNWADGNHLWTSDYQQVPGMPPPYIIVPASGTSAIVASVPTSYDRWDSPGSIAFDSIISGSAAARVFWQTSSTVENVNTPVYSGPALVSDQNESTCIHERWDFAPGFGLVLVTPYDNGSCTPSDPLSAMKRIA